MAGPTRIPGQAVAHGHVAAHALDVDFARPPRWLSRWGALLLVAGLGAALATALDALDASTALDHALQQHDRLQRAVRPAARPALPLVPRQGDAQQGADALVRPWDRPWDAVLRGIEQNTDASVSLLSLDAQGAAGLWRLSGEAHSVADALAYAERLRVLSLLRSVDLVAHEWRAAREGQGPTVLRFTLELRWSAPR